MATSYYNIGNIYYNLGDYPKALGEFFKVLAIYENALERNDQKTENVKDIIRKTQILINPHHLFTFNVVEGGKAYEKGLRGKYHILYYEGWEIGETKNLFQHNLSLIGKPKRIVVMNESGINEYNFGTERMGMMIDVEEVSSEHELEIMKQFTDWKKQNNK